MDQKQHMETTALAEIIPPCPSLNALAVLAGQMRTLLVVFWTVLQMLTHSARAQPLTVDPGSIVPLPGKLEMEQPSPEVPGKADGKSGPAVRRDGTAATDQGKPATRLQDTSGIQGKPGGKSGPAVPPPR